jgi:hydroxyacylglutathione hydrolase
MVERIVVGTLKTNCYIYSSAKKECVIIDPGGDAEGVTARVDVLNMVPVGIVLTHGHLDHVAAVGALKASYAARGYPLKVAVHAADRKFLGPKAAEAHRTSLESLDLIDAAVFGDEFPQLPKADLVLRDGERVLGMDLEVIETPGHTAGSVCLWSSKEGILFSGDTLFFDGVGRTDLPGGDEKKLRASIQRRLIVLPPETRVFPGHGPFTTIERERKTNPFMRAAP